VEILKEKFLEVAKNLLNLLPIRVEKLLAFYYTVKNKSRYHIPIPVLSVLI